MENDNASSQALNPVRINKSGMKESEEEGSKRVLNSVNTDCKPGVKDNDKEDSKRAKNSVSTDF